MRRSDLVACDCLTVITFSNNLDTDQARQNAESDRSLQCLQDSYIKIIGQCINKKFCYVFLA